MLKNIGLLICILAVVGCSSGEKSTDDSSDSYSGLHEDTSSSSAEEKVSRSSVKAPDPDALVDAIKGGSDDKIRDEARKRLAVVPDDGIALNAMGVLHLKGNQPVAAEYFFTRALKGRQGPKAEIYSNLGLVAWKFDNKQDAVKNFRKALEIDSRHMPTLVNLGSFFIEERDYKKALVAFEAASSQGTKDSKVWNNLGIAYTGTQKYDKALQAYKKALDLSQGNREYLLNLAILQVEHLKKYDEGLDTIGKIKFLGPTSEASSTINLLENKAKAGLQ